MSFPVLKRLIMFILCILLFLSSCTLSEPAEEEYTLRISLSSASSDGSLYTSAAEEAALPFSLCEPGFVRSVCSAESSESGWMYEMALSIEDITASWPQTSAWNIGDSAGRVFRIHLNPEAVWEDGTPITADSYLQSMQLLLNPLHPNSDAFRYTEGTAALCGADRYAKNGTPQYVPLVPPHEQGTPADYSRIIKAQPIYLHLTTRNMTLSPDYSVFDLMQLGFVGKDVYRSLEQQADSCGFIEITEENLPDVQVLASDVLAFFGLLYNEDSFSEMLFIRNGENWIDIPFSEVGLQKSGIYELLYITRAPLSLEEFLTAMEENWLVYAPLYEQNPELYGTSPQTYRSYGPYCMESIREDGTITLLRNTNWFGYQEKTNGSLYAPDRIQWLQIESEQAISLWERGLLDLCLLPDTDPAMQRYSTYQYCCSRCGLFCLLSPRLDAAAFACLKDDLFTAAPLLLFGDSQWQTYRNARRGYAVLPQT